MIQAENELMLMYNFVINIGQDLQYGRQQPLRFVLVILTSPVRRELNVGIYVTFSLHISHKLISGVKNSYRKHVSIGYKGTVTSLVKKKETTHNQND